MERPASTTLLLPPRARMAGQRLPAAVGRALARADALPPGEAGERAQLLRHFELLPRGWPVAALTRGQDARDADTAAWVRADPAWVRPDINGARLLATGEGLRLGAEDVAALLPALRTLFGDAGCPIDAPVPTRWYLRLPPGSPAPAFAPPDEALGTDLSDVLVGAGQGDAAARRWRGLLNEAQILLHTHPWNEARAARGLPPVNSLWFWGAGTLPDQVVAACGEVHSDEVLPRALGEHAGAAVLPRGDAFAAAAQPQLVDLRSVRDTAVLLRDWLEPAVAALARGTLSELRLDCADGAGWRLLRRHRWRAWRRPLEDWPA